MIVTTGTKPRPDQVTRAQRVAARCGVPWVPRRGALHALLEAHNAGLAYIVARDRDRVTNGSDALSADVGLLHAHRAAGHDHPLIRALGPLPPDPHIVDSTLGLAHDALHVAAVTGAQVTGLEISPALYSLLEEGLPRLAQTEAAAAQITPHLADARERLPTLSADVVMLSPMFDTPKQAPPGFALLRPLATDAGLDATWLHAALQCAPRVVLKARPQQPVPEHAEPHLRDVIRGKALDYWVLGPT